VPQVIGPVEYVGSPYHVHFGDSFTPRCIALDKKGQAFDLHFPSPKRVMLDCEGIEGFYHELDKLARDDQVKVRFQLTESEKHEWQSLRRIVTEECADVGVVLCGLELKVDKSYRREQSRVERAISPEESVYRFVRADDLGGDLYEVALECMNG
jgi:hypothetical protein